MEERIITAAPFAQLGLGERMLATLEQIGFETPTPIQIQAIPVLLEGRDIVGQAQTGTGKTAAFVLPMLERIDLRRRGVQALILTPTRELALQVAEAVDSFARHMGRLRLMPIYGGTPIGKQFARLRAGVHIVVGTPGRIIDHIERGSLELNDVMTVVLDEADEMLRMGFIDDVEWILKQTPSERQTALFSATMPREIRRIAERHLRTPVTIEIERRPETAPDIEQQYINVREHQKMDALTDLLTREGTEGEATLIFVRTKIAAADVAEHLQAEGYDAEPLHGGMSQPQRERVIRRVRAGQVDIIVATDVAARGLDVERITRVVNFDAPSDAESYVHRIGRTGRAGRSGRSFLFVTPRDTGMMRRIESIIGRRLNRADGKAEDERPALNGRTQVVLRGSSFASRGPQRSSGSGGYDRNSGGNGSSGHGGGLRSRRGASR